MTRLQQAGPEQKLTLMNRWNDLKSNKMNFKADVGKVRQGGKEIKGTVTKWE